MDKFIEASERERELMTQLFKAYNINSYIFTPAEGYDREEGYYTATTTNQPIIFEVKNRDISSDKYRTTMIEESKVRYLLQKANERNEKAIIFFFFNDGYWMPQELFQDIYYSTSYIPMPATTMGNNNEMVLKPCIEFLVDKSKLKRYELCLKK